MMAQETIVQEEAYKPNSYRQGGRAYQPINRSTIRGRPAQQLARGRGNLSILFGRVRSLAWMGTTYSSLGHFFLYLIYARSMYRSSRCLEKCISQYGYLL